MIECKLLSSETQTAFGPLCALGYYLTKEGILEPLSGVQIAQKTVKHSPTQKLLDALVGILGGCSALYEINCRLRPDLPLQRAFGRERVADQSTISKTLNAFTERSVHQLREAIESIQCSHSALFSHDFEQEMLLLEVDLTGLRASKQAEGSTKGYFSGERNTTGRQLVRVSAPRYGEVIFEKLYPGNTNSCEVLKESLSEVERLLELGGHERKRTLIRIATVASAPTITSTGSSGAATSSSPKATGEGGLPSWQPACPRRIGERDPREDNSLACPLRLIATLARRRPW